MGNSIEYRRKFAIFKRTA